MTLSVHGTANANSVQAQQPTARADDVAQRKSDELTGKKTDPLSTTGTPVLDQTASGTPAEVETMMQHFVSNTSEVAASARRLGSSGDNGGQIGVRTVGAGIQGASGSSTAR